MKNVMYAAIASAASGVGTAALAVGYLNRSGAAGDLHGDVEVEFTAGGSGFRIECIGGNPSIDPPMRISAQ